MWPNLTKIVLFSQKMGGGMHHGGYFPGKKEMQFPMDTVEATQPLLHKRRRLMKNDIGKLTHLVLVVKLYVYQLSFTG